MIIFNDSLPFYVDALFFCCLCVLSAMIVLHLVLYTDLSKLALLNLEGCPVTAACLEYISGLLPAHASLYAPFLTSPFPFLLVLFLIEYPVVCPKSTI